ncbi:MAG: hypothetical protein JXB26_17785 [Candidatus Aminicenantes bacterium]|nr:hypothetical protein [Candidatus Aminicenantes bacterium]
MASHQGDLIAPESLGPVYPSDRALVSLIIFPHFNKNKSFEYIPLIKAQTSLKLVGCLINARNLPENGFPEVIRIARTIPAFSLEYNRLNQIQEYIEDTLENI